MAAKRSAAASTGTTAKATGKTVWIQNLRTAHLDLGTGESKLTTENTETTEKKREKRSRGKQASLELWISLCSLCSLWFFSGYLSDTSHVGIA
jgi:hypothetical protein